MEKSVHNNTYEKDYNWMQLYANIFLGLYVNVIIIKEN